MIGITSYIRHPARDESGFTLIELLVAMAILAGGIAATLGVFAGSQKLSTVGEKEQIASHVAEREVEAVLSLGYDEVGLTAQPTSHSTDLNDPNFYVITVAATCSSLPTPCFQWDRNTSSALEPFCAADSTTPCASGVLDRGPTAWTSGKASGSIYRYVTWFGENCTNCNGATDYKRVTVAVTVNSPNAPQKPIWNSTIVSNPTAGPGAAG